MLFVLQISSQWLACKLDRMDNNFSLLYKYLLIIIIDMYITT